MKNLKQVEKDISEKYNPKKPGKGKLISEKTDFIKKNHCYG